LLDQLETIVRRIGTELLALKDSAVTQGTWEGTQLKTEADRIAHKLTVEGLAAVDPDIPVISEEDLDSQHLTRPDHYFLIDPIDGTASYSGGFPGYVTQIAYMENAVPRLAAIYAPAFDQIFLAEKDGGAILNGERLELTPRTGDRTLIDNYPEPRGTAVQAMCDLSATGYVECGGISLKICRIADGTAQMFYKDVVVRDWDVGAPALVLREAGGVFTELDGSDFSYDGSYEKPGLIAASNLDLANEIQTWIDRRMNAEPQRVGM
jgi:3'(2'), 5'-bisphosphate nucleotidase